MERVEEELASEEWDFAILVQSLNPGASPTGRDSSPELERQVHSELKHEPDFKALCLGLRRHDYWMMHDATLRLLDKFVSKYQIAAAVHIELRAGRDYQRRCPIQIHPGYPACGKVHRT